MILRQMKDFLCIVVDTSHVFWSAGDEGGGSAGGGGVVPRRTASGRGSSIAS